MSFPLYPVILRSPSSRLDRLLRRRWVQCGLFVAVFVLFWLLGAKTAHA